MSWAGSIRSRLGLPPAAGDQPPDKPKAPDPPKPDTTREAIPDRPLVEGLVRIVLVVVGIALIAAGAWTWLEGEEASVATTLERTTAKARSTGCPQRACKGGSCKCKKRRLKPTKRTTTETTEIKGPASERATASAPQSVHRRSETMAIAFLGFGTALLLTAGLYRRLNKLTLPGGTGLEFLAMTRASPSDVAKIDERSAAVSKDLDHRKSPQELRTIGLAQLEEEKRVSLLASVAPPETPILTSAEAAYPPEFLASAEAPPDAYFDDMLLRAIETYEPEALSELDVHAEPQVQSELEIQSEVEAQPPVDAAPGVTESADDDEDEDERVH